MKYITTRIAINGKILMLRWHLAEKMNYSSPPLTRTPKGKEKLVQLTGVGVRFLASSIPTKIYSTELKKELKKGRSVTIGPPCV